MENNDITLEQLELQLALMEEEERIKHQNLIMRGRGYGIFSNTLPYIMPYIMPYENRFEKTPQYIREDKKIGRNELCPCGSGKKYKKCCAK